MSDELEQLRAQVAALNASVAQNARQSEQNTEATAAAITHLEEVLAEFIEHPPASAGADDHDEAGADADEAPDAVAWVDYASDEDWVALADWVDWLTGVYDLHDDRRVRPCWPAHLGVAEELAAVWSAWLEAASRAREADGDALAFWHDRYLAPFLARVNRGYNIGLCRDKHTTMRPAGATDRTLIDVRSAATSDEDRDGKDCDTADGLVLAVASS